MDNEKYGIELELVTNKFNEKINKVKHTFSSLAGNKEVKLNVNTAQINYVKSQIYEIERLLKKADKGYDVGDVLKLEAKLEKLNNQYNKLISKQDKLKISATVTHSTMAKGLEKVTSKIKRFGLSLLGIRTIWAVFSRASSAYMSQNEELSNKVQSAWAGLGALLSPIIEKLVDLFAKAVKYIAIFVQALTGVDLLAKATAKSMNKTTASAKGLNKALAGFDELNNLDTNAGGGDLDLGNGLKGLENVEIDAGWAEKIQRFGGWFKTNWTGVLSGFLGLKATFMALTPLIQKFGLKLGVIKALGIGAMVGGIVYSILSLLQYLKDPTWENFGKIIQGIGIAIIGLGAVIASIPVAVAGAVVLIVGTITKYWDKIKEFLQKGIDWLVGKTDWVREHFGIIGEAIYNVFTGLLQSVLDIFDSIITGVKNTFDGIIKFLKGVFTGDWQQAWDGVKQIFISVFDAIKGVVTSVWNFIMTLFNAGGKIFVGIVDGIANVFKWIINTLITGINWVIAQPFNFINGILNKIKSINILGVEPFMGLWDWNPLPVPQIPQLAVGTNYVPQNQLAMIHKGEAVIPKKFNSQEYFGGNDETNSLLKEVIDAVNNIEINPYTTVRDVGKASLSYINSKSRQLGMSVVN